MGIEELSTEMLILWRKELPWNGRRRDFVGMFKKLERQAEKEVKKYWE